MSISGNTRVLCVIGDPVAHSLSPRIHNAFLAESGLDYVYLAFQVKAGDLGRFIHAVQVLGIKGFNVTMPHKEWIVPFLDDMTEQVRRCGAVNTVAVKDGRLVGHNTDGAGFLRALALGGIVPVGMKVLILGRGGAAKTVALALADNGANVLMAARNMTLPPLDAQIEPVLWEEIGGIVGACDMVVNATPLGMPGQDFSDFSFVDGLPEHAYVVDLVYHPSQTTLLRRGHDRGLQAMNGLRHLVCQGALSFEFFTEITPSLTLVDGLIRDLSS